MLTLKFIIGGIPMANKNRKNLIEDESIEDTTMYGEFIPSFDQWTTFENQKERCKYLQNCTGKNKDK